MAFSLRAIANNRYEILSDAKDSDRLIALGLGRRNAELIVNALNAKFGSGEQLDLFHVEHKAA